MEKVFLPVGQQKLLARLEVFKLLTLWDEKRQIIITRGTWRSYLGRGCECYNNVSLLNRWFLVSGKAISFSPKAYLFKLFCMSLLRKRLIDQKCRKCVVEIVLPLNACLVFYVSYVGSAGIGQSIHFGLHNFIPVLVPSMCTCSGSMCLMALLCEVFMPVVKGHIFYFSFW